WLEDVMISYNDVAVHFLRQAIDFDGLIIYEPTSETIDYDIINAIKNSSDMFLPRSTYKTQLLLMESVYQAVRNGEIPAENIHRTVDRILSFKQKINRETPEINRDDYYELFSVLLIKHM